MKNFKKKVILLGDLHFGIKGFSVEMFENQFSFFENQLIPYMKDNNIKRIIQLGDFLDNRKIIDINFFNLLDNKFFNLLEKNNIEFITLLGNHDIYYKSKLDINLIKYFEKLYPNNFKVFQKKEILEINNKKCYFVPWLIDDIFNSSELDNINFLFGHFEIRDFLMVKGHKDTSSNLTSKFFQKKKNLKAVFSGHYHIKSSDGFVHYLGTPYQLNWGDFDTQRGFYIWDTEKLKFIENKISKKFIKIEYNELNENLIVVKGFKDIIYFNTIQDFNLNLSNCNINLYINGAKENSKEYEVFISLLKDKGLELNIINNIELKELINEVEIEETDKSTSEIILNTTKEVDENIFNLLQGLIQEIESEE